MRQPRQERIVKDEKELIERAQRGEMGAFRELVERYQKTVYFLALDLCGRRQDAEDLSQEVFLKAYRFLPNFRGEARLSSWLYRITMNCFMDTRRKKQLPTLSLHSDAPGENHPPEPSLPDPAADPSASARSDELQRHIRRALDRLSPRERSVFVLRHYQELPLKEIGEMLEIAEGTVKALLFRAIKRLQKELAIYRAEV